MPRPKTKEELMLASKENYEKLNRFKEKQSFQEKNKEPKKAKGISI